MRATGLGTVLAVTLAACPAAARAEGPAAPRDFALTVSGGVSLGAYEAGFLYYMLETLRENPWIADLRVVTGSSAGGTNGLLSILSRCAPARRAPEASLFWRTWIPLGFEALDPGDAPARQGVLSRGGLIEAAERMRATWEEGLPEACDVVLGVAVTRVIPRVLRGGDHPLELPRIEEKFVLRLQGRGPGRPPRVTNYLDPSYRLEQLALPVGPDGAVGYDALKDLLLASASFPVAFAPMPLRHCTVPPGGAAAPCAGDRVETALFIDGGIFDNSPLRLAARTAAAGLGRDRSGRPAWRDVPELSRATLPESMLFTYLTPDATTWPAAEELRAVDERTSFFGLAAQLSGAIVTAGRTKELYTLLEEHPEIAERIVVPRTHWPAAGAPLEAFLGFFERDFRVFDFTLGMYEARRMFTEDIGRARLGPGAVAAIRFPEAPAQPWPAAEARQWRGLACLRWALDGAGEPAACAGPDLAQLRVLAQTSIERLYAACARAGPEAVGDAPHPRCREAAAGAAPPRLAGVAGELDFRRAAGEGELAHFFRLLDGHGFRFRDLAPGGDAALALHQVRLRLGRLGSRLAAGQPADESMVVSSASRLLANVLAFSPPRHELHLVLGREVEVGGSVKLTDVGPLAQAWRLHGALQLHGVTTGLSSDRVPFAVSALAGVEVMSRLSGWRLQASMGARGGALLAYRDRFATQACPLERRERIGACSRPVVQAFGAVAAVERLRVQVAAEWYPPTRTGDRGLWAVSPSLGIQLTF